MFARVLACSCIRPLACFLAYVPVVVSGLPRERKSSNGQQVTRRIFTSPPGGGALLIGHCQMVKIVNSVEELPVAEGGGKKLP